MSFSTRKIPELLAPAGSWDALEAAVAAGADAVYLGGRRFGARRFASNFDQDELSKAVDFAHERDVRVYVTVNTLIHDRELSVLSDYLLNLYEIGADAIIVQDLGAAALARELVPELLMHASTQMTVHSSYGVEFAASLGFKRVVLARELSLAEIKSIGRIAKPLGVGLEVFIHGALCYSYSGQCLLSSSIGGRSGNRGSCAQPCRKPYVLMEGKRDPYGRPLNTRSISRHRPYLLSTRDLCVYSRLDEVVRSPVESLKIEGRMKSAHYVAVVTSIYRGALDAISNGRWSPSSEDMRDLALAFNRDFTDGYLLGSDCIMGRKMPDKRGICIGSVVSYDSRRGSAAISQSGPLLPSKGDGLVFISPQEEVGAVVQSVPEVRGGLLWLKVPKRVGIGAEVFVTGCGGLSRRAETIIKKGTVKIPIDLFISMDGMTMVVRGRISSKRGPIEVEARSGFEMEKAQTSPLDVSMIEANMRRSGGSQFVVREVHMSYPGGLFAPIGAINQLRRGIIAVARERLLSSMRPDAVSLRAARARRRSFELPESSDLDSDESGGRSQKKVPVLAVYAGTIDTVAAAVDGGCNRVYFEPALRLTRPTTLRQDMSGYLRSLSGILHEAVHICRDKAVLVWKWPKITPGFYLDAITSLPGDPGIRGVMVEGTGALQAAVFGNFGFEIFGGPGLNVWNHLSVGELSMLKSVTLSPELSCRDQHALISLVHGRIPHPPGLDLVVQGSCEVIVTKDRLKALASKDAGFLGLNDFKRLFAVYEDDMGFTHIQNSVETCLIDHMPSIIEMGMDTVSIDARNRTASYAGEMSQIYCEAICKAVAGDAAALEDLKERARCISMGGITTGHFVRGLKEADDRLSG